LGRAFDAANVAVASVARETNTVHNENNSANRNTANNVANSNTENSFNLNPTAENNNSVSQSTVFLLQYPIYSHVGMTASDMYSNHVPDPSGFPVLVGSGPVTTWSVDTHPVHREMTSSNPSLGIFGPGSSQPGNPFVDVHSRCGLPPSAYYYGVPSATPAGLPFPVPMYPTAGPTAATPYRSTSSALV